MAENVKQKSDSIYSNSIFKFNLLPKITKEEVAVLVERDNSIFYAFLLVFSAMLVFFVLSMIEAFLIRARINTLNDSINQTNININSYNEIKSVQGELIRKANLLEEPLSKDIKITELFDVANDIVGNNGVLESYQRQPTGEFSITVKSQTISNLYNITKSAKSISSITDVKIIRIGFQDNINLTFPTITLQFEIINI